mmetsp:Transcript_2164/g.3216  ORF Transcript_2164/g.3216 Transcript_2164/m.3216 type:complete len:122 (+) Transcript_2164:179-544(+)
MSERSTSTSKSEQSRKRTVTFRNEVDIILPVTEERSEDEIRLRWYTDREIRKMKKNIRAVLNCYHQISKQEPIELLGIEDPRRMFETMRKREFHIRHILRKQSMNQIDSFVQQQFINVAGC